MIYGIVAVSKNNVIGLKNNIPWNCPEDVKRFKNFTKNNTVIMGRKTYEAIGKPLVDRNNVVITRSLSAFQKVEGIYTANSIQNALDIASKFKKDIYIIGGEEIYNQAIDLGIIDYFYITIIDAQMHGDAFFDIKNLDSKHIPYHLFTNDELK